MKAESKTATQAMATAVPPLVIAFLGASTDRARETRQIVAMNAHRTAANHAKSVATPQVTAMWTSGQRPAFAGFNLALTRVLSKKRNTKSREIRGTRLGRLRSQMAKSSRLRRGRKRDACGKVGCCLLFRGWRWLGCTGRDLKSGSKTAALQKL